MASGEGVKDAAARLGIKPGTLLKRLQAGGRDYNGIPFKADKVNGPRGPEWRVWLDEGASQPGTEPSYPVTPQPDAVALMRSMLGEAVAEAVTPLVEEVRRAHQKGIEDAETIARLTAEAEALRREAERARRPWWKRWRG